jgi:hypothetical protein
MPLFNNYDCTLVIIDHFTKYAIYIPVTRTLDAVLLSNDYIRDYFKSLVLPNLLYLIEINFSPLTIGNNLYQALKLS